VLWQKVKSVWEEIRGEIYFGNRLLSMIDFCMFLCVQITQFKVFIQIIQSIFHNVLMVFKIR